MLAKRVHTAATLVVAVLAVAAGGLSGASFARGGGVSAFVVKPRFHQVALPDPVYTVTAKGVYAFVTLFHNADERLAILDERIGKKRTIGCGPLVIGAPFSLVACPQTMYSDGAELLTIATGRRRGLPVQCFPHSGTCGAVAIGKRWIEYGVTCGRGCRSPRFFQRISSHAISSDPTAARTFPDLDSSTLAHRLCAPLRMPLADAAGSGPGRWGTVTLDGKYVLASGTAPTGESNNTLLRCGSRLRRVIGQRPTANQDAVIWQTNTGQLVGLTLPRLRRFAINLPRSAQNPGAIALSSRTLYVVRDQRLWAARWPAPR